MKLIIVHNNKHLLHSNNKQTVLQGAAKTNSHNLLRFAVCTEPLSGITFSCLSGNSHDQKNNETIAIPHQWCSQTTKANSNLIYYKDSIPVPSKVTNRLKANRWFIISNGRYVVQFDDQLLNKILARSRDDIVAVNVASQLKTSYEKVLISSRSKLVGLRSFFNDLAQPAPISDDWPHYLFIRTNVLNRLLADDALPLAFSGFINACSECSLTVQSLNIGGTVFDLEMEADLLALLAARLSSSAKNFRDSGDESQIRPLARKGITISPNTKLFGKVLFGKNISIGQDVIIVGPTIIGSGVKIATGAVIKTSIIGPGVSVPQNNIVQNRILIDSQSQRKHHREKNTIRLYKSSCTDTFRIWPKFSYAGYFKRIADVVAAILVFVFFAPIVPIIALVIKLTSPGPVFFKDKRQGLHSKVFNCLKFRTMLVDADKMQEKLRVLNQADGPQFKVTNDPRISIIGRFLRDTYIDEIPQFFNVLLGQMSVVGPRPSPESENMLCPPWRDARLSVRPGITGLWQVCRTRQPMKDFQEWIHYDIKYVKDLSLKTDLWICWKTARKMAKNFIDQF